MKVVVAGVVVVNASDTTGCTTNYRPVISLET
jgi:hypothetical protein